MKEIEILVEVFDSIPIALSKLSSLGKHKKNKTKDIYYYQNNNPKLMPYNGQFPKECFRLRSKNDKTFITYKIDKYKKNKWIFSEEYETQINDFETMQKIINQLGFVELVRLHIDKYIFQPPKYEIVLEEVKQLGTFIEVELKKPTKDVNKAKKEIWDFIKQLDIKTSKELNYGKPELMFKKLLNIKRNS